MEQILIREVKEINGKEEWIEPTLQFAVDKWAMDDPRDIITILSCGGDRLMKGDYQKDTKPRCTRWSVSIWRRRLRSVILGHPLE